MIIIAAIRTASRWDAVLSQIALLHSAPHNSSLSATCSQLIVHDSSEAGSILAWRCSLHHPAIANHAARLPRLASAPPAVPAMTRSCRQPSSRGHAHPLTHRRPSPSPSLLPTRHGRPVGDTSLTEGQAEGARELAAATTTCLHPHATPPFRHAAHEPLGSL